MKALIYGDVQPESVDCSIAFHGFEDLNYEIVLSKQWLIFDKKNFEQFEVCVGGVDICRFALNKMGIKNYDIPCYPLELMPYLYRNIQIIKAKHLYKLNEIKFIKPVRPKRFQAFLTNDDNKLMSIMDLDDNEEIYVSDIVNFESEWRVYVENNEIKLICNYNGDPTLFPNVKTIREMIKSWSGPCCYALDVGELCGKTSLVEFNDFYSLGNYGLFPKNYVQMLTRRWKELKNGNL